MIHGNLRVRAPPNARNRRPCLKGFFSGIFMKIMPLPQEAKVEDTITMGADADEEAFSRGREGMHKVNWCECGKKFRSSHHWRRKGPFSFGDSSNAHPNFLVATHGVVLSFFRCFSSLRWFWSSPLLCREIPRELPTIGAFGYSALDRRRQYR